MNSARLHLRSVAAAFALASCASPDVVATVGSTDVLRSDVALYAKSQTPRPLTESLDAVVARQLLAEGATRRGLAARPEVAARLSAARRELLAQALIDEASGSINDAQAEALYQASKDTLATRRMQAAHIFFALPVGAPRAATERTMSNANTAWARLLGGEDFAKVAAEVSEDEATKAGGGALGELREGQVSSEIFQAASKLGAGEISKPIATDYGIHILKAVTKAESVTPTFAEVKGQLLAQLRRQSEAKLVVELAREIKVKRSPEKLEGEQGAAK